MAKIYICNENDLAMNVNEEANVHNPPSSTQKLEHSDTYFSPSLTQKVLAELIGTYFMIYAGCATAVLNVNNDNLIPLLGAAIVAGLALMVLIYSVGHISGAHFNPAVTITFAICKRFPLKQVPVYILAQIAGSTLAVGTLRLLFSASHVLFTVTAPQGSDLQAFVIEFIVTFHLMFIISGVATDDRAIREFAGVAIGSTIMVNVMIAGPISGASMNPARSLGSAIMTDHYEKIWIYLTSPVIGAVSGGLVYNTLRCTDHNPCQKILN